MFAVACAIYVMICVVGVVVINNLERNEKLLKEIRDELKIVNRDYRR